MLSYDPAPEAFAFATSDSASDVVEVAVPAGGAPPVRRSFVLAENVIAADTEAPVVTLERPTTIEGASVEVFGRALDNVGVARLEVNGQTVAVGADGTYGTRVVLVPGANRITATATDGAGRSSSAALVVTAPLSAFQPNQKPYPEAVEFCVVPRVKAGSTVKAARAKLKKAGCPVYKQTKSVRSKKVRRGRVAGLSARAGTHVALRTEKVRIKVSKGRKR